MSASEVIDQIEKLPCVEQEKVFTFLAEKIVRSRGTGSKQWVGKRLSFEKACDVVFRENRELLAVLAK
jgi:transcriptional regulator with AAA-type ATPase domain